MLVQFLYDDIENELITFWSENIRIEVDTRKYAWCHFNFHRWCWVWRCWLASRSLSSEGAYGRRMLRECDGLVEAVLVVVSAAVSDQLLVDDCVIEHCVCLLRNISFACQEVVEPHYLDTKARRRSARSSTASTHISTVWAGILTLSLNYA